ncbi:hypothetical protein P3T40_000597 [Paraburkholderia sp. EB58]|uniref:hypothetical protein n=1 Tax=Paraburkholderia sp. EB58 TaxID=3035125 RepID=UPI003D1A3D9B
MKILVAPRDELDDLSKSAYEIPDLLVGVDSKDSAMLVGIMEQLNARSVGR